MKQKLINFFEATGLLWLVPCVRLVTGEDPKHQLKEMGKLIGFPVFAILLFIMIWSYMSTKIKTSVGQLPGPSYVWSQAQAMWATHKSERINEVEAKVLESVRAEFSPLILERTELQVTGKSVEEVNSNIAALIERTQKRSESYDALVQANKKVFDEATQVKKTEIDDLKKMYVSQKAFAYDDQGKLRKDIDDQPMLNEEAASKIDALNRFRVAVYEGNLAEDYQKRQQSYIKLINNVEKINKYYAKGLTLDARQKRLESYMGLISSVEKISKHYIEGLKLDVIENSKKTSKAIKKNKADRASLEKRLSKAQKYQSKGTIIDYIKLSIITVLFGFILAACVAIPLGILCGLSPAIMLALNPLIQTFRPVSPLAWVLITIQIIDGIFVGDNALEGEILKNTFLHAGITVALCSLWATLSNTALGVSSVDQDHLNVAKVLKLNWFDRIFKIVLPSAVPYIFTGLRITLGVGWMVLIVSEMMATSRGLGWFIDQEYQNNKVESLANIMVCIFIIGFIGAILDRIMFTLQKLVSFTDEVSA